jgi:hypothetical protein
MTGYSTLNPPSLSHEKQLQTHSFFPEATLKETYFDNFAHSSTSSPSRLSSISKSRHSPHKYTFCEKKIVEIESQSQSEKESIQIVGLMLFFRTSRNFKIKKP